MFSYVVAKLLRLACKEIYVAQQMYSLRPKISVLDLLKYECIYIWNKSRYIHIWTNQRHLFWDGGSTLEL